MNIISHHAFVSFVITLDYRMLRSQPPLGTISFALLCSQYIRSQMNNLGVRPYTRWIKCRRGRELAEAFPMYDAKIIVAYSETADLEDWRFNKWHGLKVLKSNNTHE